MKIIIYTDHINERGTTISNLEMYMMFQSAGHLPKIVINNKNENQSLINEEILCGYNYEIIKDIKLLLDYDCDYIYYLRSGIPEEIDSICFEEKLINHIVFPNSIANLKRLKNKLFISKWLSNIYDGKYINHIIKKPENITDSLRKTLKIPNNAKVFGCIGGKTSFDLKFVRKLISNQQYNNVYFVFVNIEKFCDKNNVIFLNQINNFIEKEKFINTCDFMLHARRLGESYGIACAEFAIRGKKILTYKYCLHKNHIEMLNENIVIYENTKSLDKHIKHIEKRSVCDINLKYSNSQFVYDKLLSFLSNTKSAENKINVYNYYKYLLKTVFNYLYGKLL